MYPASAAFHEAVANGNEQKALLIFSDAVFTNYDLNVSVGIGFHDHFNMEEDLAIGQATSNEIEFSLFNDERLLNDYSFGDFTATLGVKISESTYDKAGALAAITVGNDTYAAFAASPYLKKNGTAMATQPSQAIVSMLAYNGLLYCFGTSGSYVTAYNLSTGAAASVTVNAFMKRKAYTQWAGYGFHYDPSTRILTEMKDGRTKTFEFVPLGNFTAERPNVPDVIQIDFNCNDFMMKFEADMPDAATLGITYPTTIGNLFVKLCENVGVPYRTDTFINSTAVISAEPEAFKTATKREVLKWIAEAAGSNARFDRDGYLVLDWLRSTQQSYAATHYSEFRPYWYQAPTVNKLYNRDTNNGSDLTVGTGDECYLIQDNPLLQGVS